MMSIGSRSFAVAGPVTGNSLPADLRTLELSVPSVFFQAFEDLSLQQLLIAACGLFAVSSFLVCAVYYYYY